MNKAPAFQFYPGDWRRDTQVQMASMSTRGVWHEMLCCMWDAPDRGKLTGPVPQLAQMFGCHHEELQTALREISALNIGDVTFCNDEGNEIVTVENRRMVREERVRKQGLARIHRYRDKACNADVTHDVTAPSSSSSSSSSSKPPIIPPEKKNGKRPKKMTDEEWLRMLKESPAYKGIDIDLQIAKCEAWCKTNSRTCTRRTAVNWLNRADKPISKPTQSLWASEVNLDNI